MGTNILISPNITEQTSRPAPIVKAMQELGFVDANLYAKQKNSSTIKSVDWSSQLALLRINDLQQFVRRFNTVGLPPYIRPDLVERIMYYRATAMLFIEGDRFYMLPWAPVEKIDCYGRWQYAKPLVFGGSASTEDKEFLTSKKYKIVWDISEKLTEEDLKTYEGEGEQKRLVSEADGWCVILYDRSQQLNSDERLSRRQLIEPVLQQQIELLQMINVANFKSLAIDIISTPTEKKLVTEVGLSQMKKDVLASGVPLYVMNGTINKNSLQAGTYNHTLWAQWTALDNYRLYTMGVTNSGGDQSDYKSISEVKAGQNGISSILRDALEQREQTYTLANWVFSKKNGGPGLNISVGVTYPITENITDIYQDKQQATADLVDINAIAEGNANG